MSEKNLSELFDRYLNGELSSEEREQFETMCYEDADVASRFAEHKSFVATLKHYSERLELEQRLNAIHDEIDVQSLTEELEVQPLWVIKLWRHHHSKISVAASIAIFAVLCTLFFTGSLKNNDPAYMQLKREIAQVKQSTAVLDKKNTNLSRKVNAAIKNVNPGSFRGTGFALTSNGYLVTNYHVVNGADSVYVQNADGESFHAKVIYIEPVSDIAILQINDPAFKTLGNVPYSLRKSKSDLGEDVFTIGYPTDAIRISTGYLASSSGLNGDSTFYETSVAARPGNSGGPLLDSRGNVIGIISGKQTQYESSSFAKKSGYLMDAIDNIPADSLAKPLYLSSRNSLSGLSRTQQIKKLQNFVFMVKVYN